MKITVPRLLGKVASAMNRAFRLKSIQFIITASFSVITVTSMLFVGITLYNKFSKVTEQNAIISTRQVIDQVNQNLDYYLRSMMEISDSLNDTIYYNEDITNEKLGDEMQVILNTRKDIVTLALFSDKGELISGVPGYKPKEGVKIVEQDWFKNSVHEPGNLFFSTPHVQNIFKGQHTWVVSLSREVTLKRYGKRVNGVLLVDMNFSTIDQLCQKVSLGKRGYLYMVDSEGNIVYHPQQQLIYIGLKFENNEEVRKHVFGSYFDVFNGEQRLVVIETVSYCRWRIVGIAFMDEIQSIKNEVGGFAVWLFIFGFILTIAIAAYISAKIAYPIKQLERSMKMVEEGMLDITIDVKGEHEVVQLSRTFKIMITRIKQLMDQIVQEQEAKRKSELNALQAQINPHFLYNTLDSIVWMAENGKSSDVITMVTALAKLFRISISRGRNVITVQQELEHAKNYMIIQKIRYKNRFKFNIEAQEEVLQCRTMKLILQPIIENAIYHGIEYMVEEGLIAITVEKAGNKLLYKVSDNGVGMKPETLQSILLYEPRNNAGSGVGVKNVHERIQLYYGKEYGLEIESEQDEGTTVRIWIPYMTEEN